MRVHVFSLCWNEEKILPFFFQHYRQRFNNIQFTIYDNGSTDASIAIMKEQGAEIRHYETDNTIRGDLQLAIKNEAWKCSTADWIIVCDVDEWIACDDAFLEGTDCTIVKAQGYNMVGYTTNLDKIERGTRHSLMDKCILFNRHAITAVNYKPGAHRCKPVGHIVYNKEPVLLYHMKFFHLGYHLKRQRQVAVRVSAYNKSRGWSQHYHTNTGKSIAYYLMVWLKSKKVRTPVV